MNEPIAPHDWGKVEGFPRIDRYFPDCWCATVEAAARHQFQIDDFGKIYGFHSFRYRRPEGPIRFRPNGVELDLELHRAPLSPAQMNASLEDIYGVRTAIVPFADLAHYWEYCRESIGHDVPIVSDFNLKFMQARREYGKVDTPHVIALCGYDPATRSLLAAEQMIGATTISTADFVRCFENTTATAGVMRVWQVTRLPQPERALGRLDVMVRLEENLQNLDATDSTLGLGALRRCRDDVAQYLEGPAFENRPFSVPGLWVFSHERHIQKKWLCSVAALYPNCERLMSELDELLSQAFQTWLSTDFLLEKCLASKNGKALRAFPKYLTQALAVEERLRDGWRELYEVLARD
jgi:hypothetical protein